MSADMGMLEKAVPFSRPVEVAAVGEDGLSVTIQASEGERAALAASYGLAGIDDLTASLTLKREPRGGVGVRGTVIASVQQTCVVTLEPFPGHVSEIVDIHYLPVDEVAAFEARMQAAAATGDTDMSEANVPDAIVSGRVDLGVLAAEFLALGLDPYPRKPGVAFAEPSPAKPDPAGSPFAALAKLKDSADR